MPGYKRKTVRSRRRSLIVPLVCLMLAGYFGYHVFHGDHGLIGWKRLQSATDDAKIRLAIAEAEHADLEAHVSLLRNESIDPDMLDQRARALLNYTGPNDVVLFKE